MYQYIDMLRLYLRPPQGEGSSVIGVQRLYMIITKLPSPQWAGGAEWRGAGGEVG